MKGSKTWVLMSVIALAGCYEHRTLDLGPVFRDSGVRPSRDGGVVRDDIGAGQCGNQTTVYRFDDVAIPTAAQGSAGIAVGLNVDARGDACGSPDYPGDVDNALMDVASALASLAPDDPVDFRDALARSLTCAPGSVTCGALGWALGVTMDPRANCAAVTFTDGTGATFSGTTLGTVSSSGELSVAFDELQLTIPYPTDNGPVNISVRLRDAVIQGTISGETVQDVIIAGIVEGSAFEETLRAVFPRLNDSIAFENVAALLPALYDVQRGSVCPDFSVGFLGHARSTERREAE